MKQNISYFWITVAFTLVPFNCYMMGRAFETGDSSWNVPFLFAATMVFFFMVKREEEDLRAHDAEMLAEARTLTEKELKEIR